MIITFSGKINTEESEELIFVRLKRWFNENLQDFELEVSGKEQTLNHKVNKDA